MNIDFSADYYQDSRLDSLLNELDLSKYFKRRSYGNDEVSIFMIVNCAPYDWKLRKRYSKKDKVLYWDIILDYRQVKRAKKREKKVILANSIIASFDILDNYKKLQLDKEKLKKDARSLFVKLGWLL